ncbi:hypothetical protein [Aureimonas psammosilenae]|uniref:hypothetical protein n=1 Tax=Aureimonas psammosilenae TaxID=2495496 RepID=UPI001260BF45|nr:hypothetical protein [Aureimonas psammosilenae]
MSRDANSIGDHDPVRLAEACELFFAGSLKPAALRTEATKGNLDMLMIAGKHFVTKAAIRDMLERCRLRPATLDNSNLPNRQVTGVTE